MEQDPRTDQQLIEAANAGDAAAFEALYRRYRDWVVRLAFRFTRDHETSLDVLQETFMYVLRKLPRLRLTARMTTFLYPTVKHIAIRARSQSRALAGDDAEILDALPAPPGAPAASRDELASVLASLPEEQREVVLMRFVDDMSLAEIASALDVPLGTVKSRLHNALATLREDERTRKYFLG